MQENEYCIRGYYHMKTVRNVCYRVSAKLAAGIEADFAAYKRRKERPLRSFGSTAAMGGSIPRTYFEWDRIADGKTRNLL